MSAECSQCGSDIVYPEGTWPIGQCPVCSRDERIELLEAVVEAVKEYDLKRRTDVMKADIAWRALLAVIAELESDVQPPKE